MKLVVRTHTRQKKTPSSLLNIHRSNTTRRGEMATPISLKDGQTTEETAMATTGTTVINSNRILMEVMETKIIPTARTLKDFCPTSQIRISSLLSTGINLELFFNYVINLVMLPKYADHIPHHKPTS